MIIFQRYIDNYGEIKELYTRGLDKSETSKRIISFICQKSKFIITNVKNKFFSCKYLEQKSEGNNQDQKSVEKNLNLENIIELRDRAQLSKVVSENKKETEMFIKLISQINTIYEYTQEIYYKGYPKSITIEVVIDSKDNKEIEFILDNNKVDNYNSLYTELKKIKDELKKAQINAYKNKPLIRYIYGRQFSFLYDVIKNNKNKKQIEPFLKYFTNNLITKYLDKFDYKETNNIFDDLITNCDNYFKKILEINNLTLEKIYEETIITKKLDNNLEYKGMQIYSCNNLEKQLYQIYKYLTDHTPSAQNILLCNEDTSYEEIVSFFYRAIFCEFRSCFIIGGIELLKSEQKSNIIELLNEVFVENYEKMNSCLIFLYTNKSSDISKILDTIKYRKVLSFKKVKDVENIMSDDKEIEIISSDKSGVGKSHKIIKDIYSKSNKHIHFPLGGNIVKEEIIERLEKLELDKYCEIHLDLYDTAQIQLMNEFLFSILFTKAYKNNDELYYFSNKNPIKIEIQNSFIELFYKFPILTLFKRTNLSIKDLSPYDIPHNIISREQIVANYLKALKNNKINNEDINFPTITPELDISKINKFSKKYNYKLEDAQLIPQQECNNLIFETIETTIKIRKPSYYQIKTFIEILGYQLTKFSQNYFLSALNILSLGDKNLNQMREYLVKNFIQITKYFIQGAFDELIAKQKITHEMIFGQYDESKDIRNAINILAANKSEFSLDKIEYPLLIFHEGSTNGFSIFANKNNKDNEYGNLLKLYEQYKKYKKKLKEKNKDKDIDKLRRYDLLYIDKFEQKDFLVELKDILDIKNPIEKSDKNKSDKKSMEEIVGTYVFTPDNFMKMIFILIRLNANIPVIMMGETGCGKTSLIRKLSELINEGDEKKMKRLNIHAGTTEKDIINFIYEEVIQDSLKLIQKEAIIKYNKFNESKYYLEKKIWLFLDEINTCNSLGLISELMCNRSFLGEELFTNIILIGACNPYRESSKKTKDSEKIGLDLNLAHKQKENLTDKEKEIIKKNSLNSNNKLVYRVNPLPFSLLNFVMDFGSLSEQDEKKYIESMVKDSIKKKCSTYNVKDVNTMKDLAINMIVKSQSFIREYYDKSSVSLREIRRFNIFFDFFCKYLSLKKNNVNTLMENLEFEKEYSFYQSLNETNIIINAINLSIYICYYLRISNKELKIKLCEKLNEISPEIPDFLEIPKMEQEYLLKNIKLEKGISKNNALLENIFSLFTTIMNKVPIFIVGKPGCSKSLSVQLINKAMKGSSSNNQLFKFIPKLIINSYQGSMGSTSKGVESVFSKTRNILTNLSKEDKNKIIPMIFFDEMGLAEYSPYNPLKIIHSELEYDLNEGDNKVAFVGISNWELDAAKMNRGIFISIPEPDEEDTINTSLTIAKSFNENLAEKHNVFFKNLGKTYYNYRQYLKTKHNLDGKEDFHGNRDFYHFVKNSAYNSSILYEKGNNVLVPDLIEIGLKSIERNFAGVQFDSDGSSVTVVKKIFNKIYPIFKVESDYDIMKCIKENINDTKSRYLLLESKSPANSYLISSILTEEKKDYVFYLGSKFEKDLKSEEYILKVLNKLQIYLEEDKILILENLDSVYPALYDLFNQNFTVVANKEYARLAVGSTSNSYSLVNPNFRCIINVNINDMDKQEIPFLNRFEKQMITYDYILSKELIDESNRIKDILKSMTVKNPAYKGINYDLEKLLINCDIEEIRGMIFDANKKGIEKGKLIDEILSKISLTLPLEILLYLKYNGFIQKYREEYKKINEYYQKGEHINLSRFIKNMKNTKNVVYTFSSELDVIKNIENINNDILGNITKIKTIRVNSIESESELEKNINEFFNNEQLKLCLIQFTPNNGQLMNYMKYFIENKEKEYYIQNKQKEKDEFKKAFIFIVHMKRIFDSELKDFKNKSEKEKKEVNKKILKETISNLYEYSQTFIDNLNGEESFSLDNIIHMEGSEIFNKCLDLEDEFFKNIYQSLFYIKYNIYSSIGKINKNTYINELLNYLRSNKSLIKSVNNCIVKQMTQESDLINKIFKTKDTITEKDIDIICIIKKFLSNNYSKKLNLFFFKAEKDQLFSSLLSFSQIEQLNKYESIRIMTKEKNEKMKNIVDKTAEIYLEKMVYNDGALRVNERLGANRVNTILGLILPGSKPILEKLVNMIKGEITDKYYQNEMNFKESKNSGKELMNDLKEYNDELNRLNNSTVVEIQKDEFLASIGNYYKKNVEELTIFYYILINDYYTLYINNILNRSSNNNNNRQNIDNNNEDDNQAQLIFENTKKYLQLLIFLKRKYLDKSNYSLSQFLANSMNWLESYVVEITILLKMFSKLNNIIPDLYEQVENIIKEKKIKYEMSKGSNIHSGKVLKVFFLGMESILKVITSNIKIYKNLEQSKDKLTQLQDLEKEILQDAAQLSTGLNLYSKEIYSLQEKLELIDSFRRNNIATTENISKIILNFNIEASFILNDKKKELCQNLYKFYKDISKIIKNDKNYNKAMSVVLYNEFLKVNDEEYLMQILKIILEDNGLILSSTQIIKIIMKKYIFGEHSEELKDYFDTISNKESPLITLLNSNNNSFLDEILLNILECEIIYYFDSFKFMKGAIAQEKYPKFYKDNIKTFKFNKEPNNFTGIIFDESFNKFKKCVEFLESYIRKEMENDKNTNLLKLYSIAYIKIYLKYLVGFIKDKKAKSKDIKDIIDFISDSPQNKFRKMIKIYILKLINSLMDSYEQFKNFKFEESGLSFHKDFSLDDEHSNILNYCFITLDNDIDKNNYAEEFKNFELCKSSKFCDDEILVKNIKDFGIDTFLCISINKIVSNLGHKNAKNKEGNTNFFNFAQKLFNEKYKCNENLVKLLFLFFDENQFNKKIKKELNRNGSIDPKLFEIILYSFRFCVQSLDALGIQKRNQINMNLLYASLLDKNCKKNLNECYIPGNEISDDMHITTLEYIEDHLNSSPDSIGCYVCSCGYYYSIQPCGFPPEGSTSTCPICKKQIGFGPRKIIVGYHGLVSREGHMRIFKDKDQKTICMQRYGDSEENVPSMTLEEYKTKVIEPIFNKFENGLNVVRKDHFLKRDKKIRSLNELSYRILNFVIYSHLFFANCLEYIKEDDFNDCLVKEMKCIEIIEKDWYFIEDILKRKGINSIQIFMNLIFKRFSMLIKHCNYFKDSNSRNMFEKQIETLVNNCLSEYNDYSSKYLKENKNLLELDNYSMKTIINELTTPTEDVYTPEEFPLFKYFMLTKYSTRDEFIKRLGPSNVYSLKYPLLYKYLLDNSDTKKLKYLPDFNEFTNYMVEKYSFRISRDEAKKKVLKSESIYTENGFKKKFNNFLNSWKKIKKDAIKYKCRPEMKEKDLSANDELIYFLNDDGELGNGMYLAAACQNFIVWQNSFLQPILDSVAQNGILHCFTNSMSRKIPVQSAKINQILLIEDCFKNSIYYNFEDLISTFSRRDIFKNDGTINYINYNSFVYDFESIEEKLGKLILPGKCLFDNEDNLNFVTYWSEGFRGGNSDVLTNFYIKYPQNDLNEEEKSIILKYIEKEKNSDFKPFFASMQLLLFYLVNDLHKPSEKIINALKNAPQYLKIDEECYNFFEKVGNEFKIEKLMNVFFFIEHLCFKDLSETLQQEYKKEIPNELQEKIKEKLLKSEKNSGDNEFGITISQLAAAIRRFISRYLAGKRESVDIDDKRDLVFDLTRIDLWEEKIGRLDNLEELLFSQIGEFKLVAGQAYEFYKLIEEKDKIR